MKNRDERKLRGVAVLVLLVSGVFILFLFSIAGIRPLSSGDPEKFYIPAGLEYLRGVAPAEVNFEHPPLAKYIIGVCNLFDLSSLCSFLSIAASSLFLVLGLRELGFLDKWWSILVGFYVFLLDPLLVSLSQVQLLDTYMIGFVSASFYAFSLVVSRGPSWRRIAFFSLATGWALASKLSSMYFYMGLLVYWLVMGRRLFGKKRGFAEKTIVALVIVVLAYLSTYIVDFARGGFSLFLSHHLRMASYMSSRHSYSPPIMFNGLLRYFLRVEVWNYPYDIFLYISTSGTSVVNWTLLTVAENKLRIILLPFLSNLFLPYSFGLSFYYLLSRDKLRVLLSSLYSSSMLMVLHGPIWWYYALPLYSSYLVLLSWANSPRRLLLVVLGLASSWLSFLVFKWLHINPVIVVSKSS